MTIGGYSSTFQDSTIADPDATRYACTPSQDSQVLETDFNAGLKLRFIKDKPRTPVAGDTKAGDVVETQCAEEKTPMIRSTFSCSNSRVASLMATSAFDWASAVTASSVYA